MLANQAIIVSNHGMAPAQYTAIIWTNADLLSSEP